MARGKSIQITLVNTGSKPHSLDNKMIEAKHAPHYVFLSQSRGEGEKYKIKEIQIALVNFEPWIPMITERVP